MMTDDCFHVWQDFDGYREYVIATLPQLKRLDGKDVSAQVVQSPRSITPSERIIAKQNYPATSKRLEDELEVWFTRKQSPRRPPTFPHPLDGLQQAKPFRFQAEGVDLEAAKRIEDAYNAPVDEVRENQSQEGRQYIPRDCIETDPNKTSPWSIETRVKDHREMKAEKERNEAKKRGNMDKLCQASTPSNPPRLAAYSSSLILTD
eukprot:1182449-Prorocentrum_minimum.AAC.1